MYADFVHLRVHSAYSLSEGAIKADKIAALALAAKMPAVAITDSGNLFGALEFSQSCIGKGVQPIVGCQVSLVRVENPRLAPDPVVVLAQDAAGLANLQRLSSMGFMQGDPTDPQLTLDALLQHAGGLFLLTGGTRGPIARMLAEGRRPDALALLARMAEAFPDRCMMELHRHGLALEKAIEPGLIGLADELGLPLVATNECFFAAPKMHEAHDALLCIAEGRQVAEAERRRVTPEHWFKPARDMRRLFRDLPDACDNTLAVARMCAVMAETRKPLLPMCPKVRPGQTEEETVRAMAVEGLAHRMDAAGADPATRKVYEDRLDYELGVIARMGFPGYFLIVADFIQWAKGQGIPVGPGRGSGVGADDHRPGPIALGPAVRAVPEPRPRVHAGLRHRFLPGPAGRGDRLRPPRIRRGPRGADHHVRQVAGPRRGAGRGPRAGDAVRPGEPGGGADPQQPGASRYFVPGH